MTGNKNKSKGKVHKGSQTSDRGIFQYSRPDSDVKKSDKKGPPIDTDNIKGVRRDKKDRK